MAAYDTLRAAIDSYIKANGNKEITGTVLNDILNAMVSALGADTRFAGVAVPSTNPGNPEGNVVYFASQAGTYSNFGGIVLPLGIHILVWNGTAWTSQTWFSVDNTPTQNSQNLATSGGILQAIVDAVGVERLRAIGAEVTSCSFDSNTKKISFFNSANTTLFQLDATAFVIDGMVSDVKIEGGNLVIQFNTDAGKQDIEIPLTDIFNPANYYTKTAIDALLELYYTKTETDALLTAINNKLADGCLYRGMAEPTTNPPTPTTKVFYIATKAGTYTNFGNIAVTEGITILKNDGSNWSKEQISYSDGVFDISAYNGTSYADLSAALGTNGANIPESLRKGGMSVKFVLSSDNNYVQYRLMAQSFSTTPSDWQGVDDEPTSGSNNLVKSGGVKTWGEDNYGKYETNSIWIRALLDKDGRIIGGVKLDGSVEWFKGIPTPIKKALDEKISIEEGKSLIDSDIADSLKYEDNDWLDLKLDNQGKIIEAVDKRGNIFCGKIPQQIIEYIEGNKYLDNYAIVPFYVDNTNNLASGGTMLYFASEEKKKLEIINNTPNDWHVCFSKNVLSNFSISTISYGSKPIPAFSKAVTIVPSDAIYVCVFSTENSITKYPIIKDCGVVESIVPTSLESKISSVINKCLRYYVNVALPYYYPNEDMGFVGFDEVSIRPLAWIAYSSAILLDSKHFDENLAGCSEEEVKHQIHRLAANLINHHTANTSSADKWGDIWQSCWWAAATASAVVLMPELFSSEEIQKCKAMIEDECDFLLANYSGQSSLYWKNKQGETLHPGDTKGEEVTWHVCCLMLGVLMNVNADKTELYKTEAVKRCIIAYSKPSDILSNNVINGFILNLLDGSNIQEDGLLVNHHKYSPEYQIALCAPFQTVPVFSKSSVKLPIALNFNSELMCKAVTDIIFDVSQGYEEPGGSMYKPGKQLVYYPEGLDWGTEMYMDKLMFDVICNTYDINPKVSFEGYARMHADRTINLQNRYEIGRVFISGSREYRGYDSDAAVPYKRETTVSMYFATALACLCYPISWTEEIWTDISVISVSSDEETNTNINRSIASGINYSFIYDSAEGTSIALYSVDSGGNIIETLIATQTITGNGKVSFTPTQSAGKLLVVTTNAKNTNLYISEYL